MAAKAKGSARWVGRRYKRKEDPRLIQGISHYTDDLKLPGLLHCVFVRSPYANARITSINTDAARSAPGVAAVITGDDLKGVGSVPCAGALPDLKVPAHPAL
ncbi:MAG: xanthine dehydrogenase family protein molybdopterin-binding subunit, partial [Acidobacteria bacterium]|nr:xanthine dehydrogenase family protein molybdopterin-binding subunit [Acidobacteriota bacterium]